MKVRMYTVYDKVAEEAGPLFTAKNDGVAARNFRNLLEQNQVQEKEEFKLLYMGEFDTSSCKATFWIQPKEVIVALHRDAMMRALDNPPMHLVPDTLNGGD